MRLHSPASSIFALIRLCRLSSCCCLATGEAFFTSSPLSTNFDRWRHVSAALKGAETCVTCQMYVVQMSRRSTLLEAPVGERGAAPRQQTIQPQLTLRKQLGAGRHPENTTNLERVLLSIHVHNSVILELAPMEDWRCTQFFRMFRRFDDRIGVLLAGRHRQPREFAVNHQSV